MRVCKIVAVSVLFLTISSSAIAQKFEYYDYCWFAGIAHGLGEEFISSIAWQVSVNDKRNPAQNGIRRDNTCSTVHEKGVGAGKRFSLTGNIEEGDVEIMNKYGSFKSSIIGFIVKSIDN